MLTKLCGFTEKNSVQTAIAQKCDFLGFVFYPKSPRFITPKNARIISADVPLNIAKVAVIVDPTFEFLAEIAQDFLPDFFQFHGSETAEFLQKTRQKFPSIKIIKAFRISQAKDLTQVQDFTDFADFFLFDSKAENEFGGSGEKFNWEILRNFRSEKDWFLSGGINAENLDEAIRITGARMIDVSSGIEKSRAVKSHELIIQLMIKTKNYAPKN